MTGDQGGGPRSLHPLDRFWRRFSPARIAPDPAALRVNLSYVLHEPSSSSVVTEHVRLIQAQARRAARAVRNFSTLSDEELLTRIVVRDESALDDLQRDGPTHVLSIDLGASTLLGRVLALVLPAGSTAPEIVWIDRSFVQSPSRLQLFGQPADLAVPQLSETIVWFAILVFRPGWNSLLLDAVRVTGEAPVSDLAPSIERALRDYTDQWWSQRPWWARPAEAVYPELREEAR